MCDCVLHRHFWHKLSWASVVFHFFLIAVGTVGAVFTTLLAAKKVKF